MLASRFDVLYTIFLRSILLLQHNASLHILTVKAVIIHYKNP
jgi:hypothetical protein